MQINHFKSGILVLLFLNLVSVVCSQPVEQAVLRDTSYTLYSSTVKYSKQFPGIQPVVFRADERILKISDLIYADYGSRKMPLDLFIPLHKSGPFPVVVMVHGGGWISGNKNMTWPMAQKLALEGYICASVEYRMLLEAPYPAALLDIKTAIRYLRSQAGKWNIDTSFVALYGCSSGGQLAALAASTNGEDLFTDKNFYPGVSDKIQALIDLDGVIQFLHPLSAETGSITGKPTLATRWLGVHHTENPSRWNEASALSHADSLMPPSLFVGSQYLRFLAGSEELIARLDSLNIYTEIHRVENSPHPFWLFEPWFTPVSDWVSHFLNRCTQP